MTRAQLREELGGPARPLSLWETARVLGGLRWVELQGFEVFGRLGATAGVPASADEPSVGVPASAASLAHAWRAAQIESLLPVSSGLPGADECTREPSPLVGEWVGGLRSATAAPSDGLAAAVRSWYGDLEAAYEARLAHVHPGADGPVQRILGRLLADLRGLDGLFRT
ncbi:MAG: hypothetical protein ACYDGN_10220 [Acidimicrobiales bacterium]